jgi:hypothetical protein
MLTSIEWTKCPYFAAMRYGQSIVMYRAALGLMLDPHVGRNRQAAALPGRACTAQVVGC